MKVVCVSDIHGELPPIEECDLLIIGGDICPDGSPFDQSKWLYNSFEKWLEEIPAKNVVGIAGNHDLVFEKMPHMVPKNLKWKYLQHDFVEINGLKIFGTPWIMPIWGAFQADDDDLKKKYRQIPDNVDILVTHGPAFGIGDLVPTRYYEPDGATEHCGSQSLRERIFEIKPQVVVFGHIHEAYGIYHEEGVKFYNPSMMDRRYVPTNYPLVFDIEPK